jgi:hypothetical protein
MGMCEYVLTKDLTNSFQVLAKNEHCNGRYSCVASVTVSVKGRKLKISRGGRFTVFGISKKLPYIKPGKNDPHSEIITTSVGIANSCNELVWRVYLNYLDIGGEDIRSLKRNDEGHSPRI